MKYTSDITRIRLRLLDQCLRSDSVEFYMGPADSDCQPTHMKSILGYVNDALKEINPDYKVCKRQLQKDLELFNSEWNKGHKTSSMLDDKDVYRGHYKILRYRDKNWRNPCLKDAKGHTFSPTQIEDMIRFLSDEQFNLPMYDVIKAYLNALQFVKKEEGNSTSRLVMHDLKARDHVFFDENLSLKGRDLFPSLMRCVLNQEVIELTYRPFGRPTREYELHCYQMRQWRGRWFLVGFTPSFPDSLGVFPIDRIKEYKGLNKEFIPPTAELLPKNYFKNVVGVTRQGELLDIILRVREDTYNYIKSKPLVKGTIADWKKHTTEDGEIYYTYHLKSYNTYELRSTIRSYGAGVEVLKPASLREELAEELKAMVAGYDNDDHLKDL